MLGLEDGVSAHGGLASVIGRLRGREARADEVGGMAADRVEAFLGDVAQVVRSEVEARAEFRAREPGEGRGGCRPSACVVCGVVHRTAVVSCGG